MILKVKVLDFVKSGGPTTTVLVTLDGYASGGVQVDVTASEGTATAGQDFVASTTTLVWGPNQSGTRSAIVTLTDDGAEEDAETVLLSLSNASSSGAGLAVVVAVPTSTLTLVDDEPAAKVVTVTSDGEATRGDQFFLAVAAPDSLALGLAGVSDVFLEPGMGIVTSIAEQVSGVDALVRRMHGLDTVRSKTTTHVVLFTVPSTQPVGVASFVLKLDYATGGPFFLTTTAGTAISLDVVTERSNRNYYLWPGTNLVGLGLVPSNASIPDLLEQPISAGLAPGFVGAIRDIHGRAPRLKEVVERIHVFDCPDEDKPSCVGSTGASTAGWSSYRTLDLGSGGFGIPLAALLGPGGLLLPFGEAPGPGSLSVIRPLQGMVFKTRTTSSPPGRSPVAVFDTVGHEVTSIGV